MEAATAFTSSSPASQISSSRSLSPTSSLLFIRNEDFYRKHNRVKFKSPRNLSIRASSSSSDSGTLSFLFSCIMYIYLFNFFILFIIHILTRVFAFFAVVTLLDYGAGNVRSLRNAIRSLGFEIKDVSFFSSCCFFF